MKKHVTSVLVAYKLMSLYLMPANVSFKTLLNWSDWSKLVLLPVIDHRIWTRAVTSLMSHELFGRL